MRTPPLRIPSSRRGAVAVRVLAAIVAVAALFGLAVAPAFAKEFLLARLDAPISFQSPPGAELLVGLIVTVPDGLSRDPLEGSRIRLRLTGPRGDVTEATARTGSTTGRYVVRIVVPAGGPRHLEVLLPAPSEVPVFLETDPFTFRPIGNGTAQLATSAAVATPGAPSSAAAIAQAASLEPQAAARVAAPPAAPTATIGVAPWLLAGAAVAVVALGAALIASLVAVARARSRRRRDRSPLAGPSGDARPGTTGG